MVGTRFASSGVGVIVDEDGDDDGALREEVFGIIVSLVACANNRKICEFEARSRLERLISLSLKGRDSFAQEVDESFLRRIQYSVVVVGLAV